MNYDLYNILAWKPNYAIKTKKVNLFNFFNQSKKTPVALPSSPIKITGKSVQDIRINKHTKRLLLYIYIQ